jgi:hypothetical protein
MWQTFKNHFSQTELKSILQSFIAFAAVLVLATDVLPQFQVILNGNWSWAAITAVGAAIARSAFKILWSMAVLASQKKVSPTN